MSYIPNLIAALAAVALLLVGVFLSITDRATSAAPILGFSFLFVVLLLLAKFKRVKGFGFEAEMWEEKQEEAAALVSRLTQLSTVLSKQMVIVASKLGFMNSHLTFNESVDLLKQTQSVLQAAKISEEEMNQILNPLYLRIELNFWTAAGNVLNRAFDAEIKEINRLSGSNDGDDGAVAAQRLEALKLDQKGLADISVKSFLTEKSLDPLIAFARGARCIAPYTLRILNNISLDFEHFKAFRSFRNTADMRELLGEAG